MVNSENVFKNDGFLVGVIATKKDSRIGLQSTASPSCQHTMFSRIA